jgi:indole-3-glycerol phosphate synthase
MPTDKPPDLLGAIVAATRHTVVQRRLRVPLAALEREAARREPRGPLFHRALAGRGVNVIAECKRRSPARGVLRAKYDPAAIAQAYERAGAAAVSVLTEPSFFDGALEHLAAVRAATSLPVLRKDFIVEPYQLVEARAFGADAVLLIVLALDEQRLRALHREAASLGLAVVTEVHDETEIPRALDAGADVIGVNSRNLRTLAVAVNRLVDMAERIPTATTAVAESGIRTPEDIDRLRRVGYRGFLVGEALVSSPDPGAALRDLLAGARTAGEAPGCA